MTTSLKKWVKETEAFLFEIRVKYDIDDGPWTEEETIKALSMNHIVKYGRHDDHYNEVLNNYHTLKELVRVSKEIIDET